MDLRYKRLGKNTLLVFLGKIGSGLIGVILLPFLTRLLSTSEFGSAELINTYSTILLSVLSCCLADAIFIFPKTSSFIGKKQYFTSGICFAILIFFIAIIISFFIRGGNGFFFSNDLLIVGLSFAMFLQSYTQQFTRSIDKMAVYSISGVIQTFFIAVFAFLLIPKLKASGYILSMIIANCIAAAFSLFASGANKFISFKAFNNKKLKSLLIYGIPLIPNSIMWWLVDGMNKPIMKSVLGLSSIGIYAVANKFPSVLNVITAAFSNAFGISVAEEYGREDFNVFFNKIFKFIFSILLLFSFIMAVFSKEIIIIFSSKSFIEAWRILPVLLLGVIFSNAAGLLGGIFMARKQSKYFFYSSLWGAVSSALCTYIFVKQWGVMGAAWATVVSFVIMFLSRLYYVWKDVNMFNTKYYVFSILLYVLTIFVLLNISGYLKILIIFILLLFLILMNKQLLIYLKNLIRGFNNAKQ